MIIIDFNNEKHTIIFTDFKRFNKTHFWSESRQNWLNPTNELDQAVGAIEHGTFLAVSRVSIRDYLLNFIQEYLFYNEVLSDINGELFNSKARDSDNIFFFGRLYDSYNMKDKLHESRNRPSCRLHLSTEKNSKSLHSYNNFNNIYCNNYLFARTSLAVYQNFSAYKFSIFGHSCRKYMIQLKYGMVINYLWINSLS